MLSRLVGAALIVAAIAMWHSPSPAAPHRVDMDTAWTGRVHGFTHDAHGQLDGFLLDTGPLVRFSPRRGGEVAAVVGEGQEVRVAGRVVSPQGERTVIDAWTVTDLASRRSIDVSAPRRHD